MGYYKTRTKYTGALHIANILYTSVNLVHNAPVELPPARSFPACAPPLRHPSKEKKTKVCAGLGSARKLPGQTDRQTDRQTCRFNI